MYQLGWSLSNYGYEDDFKHWGSITHHMKINTKGGKCIISLSENHNKFKKQTTYKKCIILWNVYGINDVRKTYNQDIST